MKPGDIEYEAPSAERFNPDPRITQLTQEGGREVFHLSIDGITKPDELEEVQLRSSDSGRTWEREGTKHDTSVELSGSSLNYRLSLDGTRLERSEDTGHHWTRAALLYDDKSARKINNSIVVRVQLAAIHPLDPYTIFGCFTDAPQPDSSNVTRDQAKPGAGLYVSHDGGDHWAVFAPQLRGADIEQSCLLGINPGKPQIMAGLGKRGIIITRDGGKNWEDVGDSKMLESPARLRGYAKKLAQAKARGADPAQTWPFNWTNLVIRSIQFVVGSESVFYIVTNKGAYKTENGGRGWCLLDTGVPKLFDIGSLYIDGRKPNRIFVGTRSKILRSDDAGCHFSVFFDAAKFSESYKTTN